MSYGQQSSFRLRLRRLLSRNNARIPNAFHARKNERDQCRLRHYIIERIESQKASEGKEHAQDTINQQIPVSNGMFSTTLRAYSTRGK